ncbi:MAG: DNA/RNA nuclease SfsA [Rhodobacteraceae bacterium]|nr:DNA/RNA nuclease SfsA [Paracoccaceae bacterium]
MRFPSPLIPGRLRFLADIDVDGVGEVTVHCPNPGSMMGLDAAGLRAWVEPAKAGAKLPYAWRLAELPGGHWAGIDTAVPNRVVKEALVARAVPELAAYGTVRPEVKYGERSRVDFVLSEPGWPDAYVEVKNVHLLRTGDLAEFPDCVTDRGARHLAELAAMVAAGHRAVMLFLVQRTDCARFALAADLDPAYARAFAAATAAGVETIVYDTAISPEGVTLRHPLPCETGDSRPVGLFKGRTDRS